MLSGKKIGRPVGSSRWAAHDNVVLAQLTSFLAAQPQTPPTTAMKSIGIYDNCAHRRIIRKWKQSRTSSHTS